MRSAPWAVLVPVVLFGSTLAGGGDCSGAAIRSAGPAMLATPKSNAAAPGFAPGSSIGTVGRPLQGGVVYQGSIATGDGAAWYQLYKASGPVPVTGTLRFDNTSVAGTAQAKCALSVRLDDTNGANLHHDLLPHGGVVSYDVTQPGQYYIELNAGAYCSGSSVGPAYSIEVNPPAQWTTGPPPPVVGQTSPGTSVGGIGPPLRGGTLYDGKVLTGIVAGWYQLYKASGPVPVTATLRFEDTSVPGTPEAACALRVRLDDTNGKNLHDALILPNTALTYDVTEPGQYYLEMSAGQYCSGTGPGPLYSIEPEPASEWAVGP